MVRPYPKIETLFKRDETTGKLAEPLWLRVPVVDEIKRWTVTEKIDGTNIRVSLTPGPERKLVIAGRTDNAQLPGDLVKFLYETFTPEIMKGLITDNDPSIGVTLYGEGYGPGIQKGGGDYRATKGFILFDAAVWEASAPPWTTSKFWWQDDETVTEFSRRLGVPRVPVLGTWTLGEIVERARGGIPSVAAVVKPRMAEGIVARTVEPLFDRRGNRLIIKLKTGDFADAPVA